MLNQQGDKTSSAESEASSTSELSPETRVIRLSNAAESLIDLTGEIGLLLFSLCYGLGLVIVNVHLGKYGIYSHSLLRLDYIMAGLWALGLLTISWLLAFVAYIGIIGPPDSLKEKPFARIPGFYRFAAFLFFFGILFSLDTLGLPLSNWSFLSKVIVISLTILVPLTLNPKSFWQLSMALGYFLMYMVIFVTEFYEHIPSRFGGGGPMQAQLVIEADAAYADFLRDKGIYLSDISGIRRKWIERANESERRRQIETTSTMRDSQTDKDEGARSEPTKIPNNNLGFGQEPQDLSQTGRAQAKQEKEIDGQPRKIPYQTDPLKVLAVTDKEYILIGISKGRNHYLIRGDSPKISVPLAVADPKAVSIPRELVKAVLSAN